jgi:hypothetical protein
MADLARDGREHAIRLFGTLKLSAVDAGVAPGARNGMTVREVESTSQSRADPFRVERGSTSGIAWWG